MKLPAILLCAATCCLAAGPEIGKPAPRLAFEQVLQAPPGTVATWETLRGHPIVLEFWATWCGPCREEIPHLNRLADQFQSRGVRFLSITDENAEVVERFLKDNPIHGWVPLDQNGRTFDLYAASARPTSILVDPGGVVRAIGHPAALSAGILEDFLSGKPVALNSSPHTAITQSAAPAITEIALRPAAPVAMSHYSPGAIAKYGQGIAGFGLTLGRLVAMAYGVADARVEGPDWIRRDGYDLLLTFPGFNPDRQAEELQKLLALTFQLHADQSTREVDVYELRGVGFSPRGTSVPPQSAGEEPKLKLSESGRPHTDGDPGNYQLRGMYIGFVAHLAEHTLKLPVFDETGLYGNYDYALHWDPARPESLVQAVHEQLGLDLVKTRRKLDFVTITSATRPQGW